MFLINYGILEDEKNRISRINQISEFEDDVNTIMGEIQLIFNNTVEGFVDVEIPYSGEFLIIWFKRLNDALINLNHGSFVTIKIPDSDNIWLEFEMKDDEVLVSQIKAKNQKYIRDFIEDSPRERSEFIWSERISKVELYETIIDSTSILIGDILSINELISEYCELKELEAKYMKSKGLSLQ
ncbi:MAG: hypothetical protein N4A63_09630 [Vallitalea sp.]|jgi:hypothetical protein|nr:hypothetical protein [Vallitalea sp.]MCT4612844.1 hypothetical protein [Clostridia bacterium]